MKLKWSKLQDHPWLASLLIALVLSICVALIFGCIMLIRYIYSINVYLSVGLIAFPLLILFIRCTWFD